MSKILINLLIIGFGATGCVLLSVAGIRSVKVMVGIIYCFGASGYLMGYAWARAFPRSADRDEPKEQK